MTKLADYQDSYRRIRFRREDGILEMAIHRDGGSAKLESHEGGLHQHLGEAFWNVAHDTENKVVIFTGLGDVWLTEIDPETMAPEMTPMVWDRIYREGKDLLHSMLDIEVPVIAALNGDAFIHSELPLLADIVLAVDTMRFADKVHLPYGVAPSDGVHVIWTALLGPNRGRYFLMTGQEITAQEALQLGVVGEVLPADKLMARAWEHARGLLQKPSLARRYTRAILTHYWRKRLVEELGPGLMAEGLALLNRDT